MEEEVGIKVTRLRRRLSVEADDVKSPTPQSTPTKKRGGRLAAKPQLELIDENATEIEKPKRTKKTAVKDAELEPEKTITPSRRSARARSNTSIISDTPAETEEKGTPSRRSTRIKSNTSIVADSVPFADSPRAKRAARRTSQVGSDTEAPVTPARQTRRTRKDSSSSIDKQVEPNAGKIGTQIKEVIAEETENKIQETAAKVTPSKESKESTSPRKSPRLNEKSGRKSSSLDSDNKENEPYTITVSIDEERSEAGDSVPVSTSSKIDNINKTVEDNNLSVSSSNLIKDLDSEPKKIKSNLNKTASIVDEPQTRSKRHRTKSWTTITSSQSHDNNFLSDTEAIKKKNKRQSTDLLGSGDGVLNISHKSVQDAKEGKQDDIKELSLNASIGSDKKKKKHNNKSMISDDNATAEESVINTTTKLNKSATDANNQSNKIDKDDLNSSQKDDPNFTEKFFGQPPSGVVQSLVYIEDSDSNTDIVDKIKVDKELHSEDQCVPVIEQHLNDENSKESKNNLSYEPMDVDETIPENISLSVFTDKNASLRQDEKQKSLLNVSQVNHVSIENSPNKSINKPIVLNQENDSELNKSKRQSLSITNSKDTTNDSINKSKRKSSLSIVDNNTGDNSNQSKKQTEFEESVNNRLSKSKRKSSISNNISDNDNMEINSLNVHIENDDTTNKSNNKSKRKSSIGNVDPDNKNNEKLHKSKQKSSISNNVNDDDMNYSNTENAEMKSSNLSKRKSSISNIGDDNNSMTAESINDKSITSNIIVEDNVDSGINQSSNDDNDMNKSSNKSKRKSSIMHSENNDSVLKDADKSKRKSSSMITDTDEVDSSSNKSKRKSSIGKIEDDMSNKSSNTSKIKSLISSTLCDNNMDSSVNKSKRKSAITDVSDTTIDDISDKAKRQSLIDNTDDDHNVDKSTNKSKIKSATSQADSQSFDKTSNENKSTLVLSQIKDLSDTNGTKDINELNVSNEQLSKSANVPNINKDKETEKKNLSLTYSTSTPLQQKSLKKLGMQINTSIIAPNSVTKAEKTSVLNRSKKETSLLSQNDEESDDDEEDSEEEEEDSEDDEESLDKSKMIEDEAEEASDDYESGDSRDEDEKEYEAQHEIVEKGETLDSEEEDFSDDSEYEKDSFIVDSEEEDNELLSGSGDDLSMSDKELSMSAKSKKKFNERKKKEQKKASREMFEARHKINESNKSSKSDKPKTKRGNRQKLESSDSESEENVSIQPKKSRRARIDSSQDISQNQSNGDKSVSKKKKKVRRLSESICEDVASNEKEISIQQNNDTEKVDPLSLQNVVKKEPKTPQKELNISTVAITNIEEVEEIQVDENASIIKMNQTSDPLQTTATQDDAMEDDSDESISENEEIVQNYESVLDNLNNEFKAIKSLDISLNLNKKNKKAKEPIVDQLNLTQVKQPKKKITSSKESSESKQLDKDKSLTNKILEKVNKSVVVHDEGSSDSIDMKLLFNEDSTDSEINMGAGKGNDAKEVADDFIPLKRTEAKTNILESTDVTTSAKDDSVLNVSKSNKKNLKSAQPEATETMNAEENVSFFIDTTGTHADENNDEMNTSVKDSAKKKKQKNNVSSANIEETKNDDDSNDAPLEISYHSEKNNQSKQDLNSTQTNETKVNTTTNETPGQSAKKKKKKNKKGLDNFQSNFEDTGNETNKSMNTSLVSVTNKKKKSLSESHIEQNTEDAPGPDSMCNVSVGSAKKQKKKTISESSAVEMQKLTEEEKSHAESALNVSLSSAKKQKKKTVSESAAVEAEQINEEEKYAESTQNISAGSAKKQKKKSVLEISAVKPEEFPEDGSNEDNVPKKRKRKPSANPSFDESNVKDDIKALNTSKALNDSVLTTNKKKKRKIKHNDGDNIPQTQDPVPEEHLKGEKADGKKLKKKTKTIKEINPSEDDNEIKSKNKKRKARADDEEDCNKLSKVTKQNSSDKVYVPRLPANILSQLDDKPKKDFDTKTKVTSTTSFMVEETRKRRNKPSNYLEQSVYLNDSIEEKTEKSQLKKPKVLPFIPTASTSNYGFTTNFRVNIIPQETQFIAQSSDVSNFKKDVLQKNRIKKLGTFEMYKRHRNIKISKF